MKFDLEINTELVDTDSCKDVIATENEKDCQFQSGGIF